VAQRKKTLVVTGYSKGGALAPLAAWLLNNNGIKVDEVHIYEPPRCGDSTFVNAFNAAFPNTVRYEYVDDLVPHMPPSKDEWTGLVGALTDQNDFIKLMRQVYKGIDSWDYAGVGTLQYVIYLADKNQYVITPQPGELEKIIDVVRMEALANDFKSGNVPLKEHDPNGHLFDVVKQYFRCPCDCPKS
jgi:hypothetical protein